MKTNGYFLRNIIVSIAITTSMCYAERPFATEDAKTAGKGVITFELSWDYINWRAGSFEEIVLFVTGYGLTDNLEVAFELPFLSHDFGPAHRDQGLGDAVLSAKWLLADEGKVHPALTLKSHVKINTGNAQRGLGSGAHDYALMAVGTKTIGRFTIHGMAGYNAIGKNGNPDLRNIYLYGLAVRYQINDALGIAAELAGNDDPNRHAVTSPMAGLVGTAYALSENVTLDTALKFGLTTSAPLWNASVGLSVAL